MKAQGSGFRVQGRPGGERRTPGARHGAWAVVLAAGMALACSAAMPPEVAEALKGVQAYETGTSLKPVKALEAYAIRIAADPAGRTELGAALAAALDAPATKPDAVAYLCRELGRVGGAAEVPSLARRLADERHSDAARLALETIPDPAAGAALRDALGRLSGRARIGVLHSLAFRADDAAVPAIKALTGDSDAATAAAAVHALGRIGSPAAAAALPASAPPQVKLDCARRLAASGHRDAARTLVEPLAESASGAPAERIAVLSSACSIDAYATANRLAAAAAGPDDFVAASAIGMLSHYDRDFEAATKAMVAALPALATHRKALMLDALALRGDAAALPAVRPLVRDADGEVREAAARALGAFGTADDVACLAAAAAGGSKAAAEALAAMKDAGADAAILAQLPGGEAATKAVLIEAALARRAAGAEKAIASALTDAGEAVQVAAARALAVVGTPASVSTLLGVMGRPASAKAGREMEAALARIGRRAADPAAVSKAIVESLRGKEATDEQLAALLRTLAGLGGPAALEAVRSRISAGAPPVRDAAVRALADWPDAAAIGDLYGLASSASDARHRAIALRGLLRLAPGAADPLDWLKKAEPLAGDPESRRALLSALGAVPKPGSLAMAVALAKDPAVSAEAALAAVAAGRPLVAADPAAVEKAMQDLLALKVGPPAEPQVRALLREARGEGAGGRPSPEERAARIAAIAKTLPQGARLAVYVDCGPERQATNGAAGLRVLGARSYAWDAAAAIDAPNATVAFSDAEVGLEVSGLDAKRVYRLGLSWWDFDGNGRTQSVWVGRDRALDKTALPSGRSGKGPARVEIALPGAEGSLRVSVRREGSSNVVLGEAWLIDLGPAAVASPSSSPPPPAAAAGPRKRILLATGLEYPGHKWRETAPLVKRAIEADPRLAVEVDEDPARWGASELRKYDAIVLHYMNWENPGPGGAAQENLRAAVSNGTGLVLVHFACGAFQGWPEFAKIAGRVWDPKLRGHDPRGKFGVAIKDPGHPVTAGMEPFETEDELYTCLAGDAPIRVLATARSKVDGKDYPMAFVLEYGRGRVFHCVLGHDVKAFEAAAVGELFRRGTAWAGGLKP